MKTRIYSLSLKRISCFISVVLASVTLVACTHVPIPQEYASHEQFKVIDVPPKSPSTSRVAPAASPWLVDGRGMRDAICNGNVAEVARLIQVGHVVQDGYTEENGKNIWYLDKAAECGASHIVLDQLLNWGSQIYTLKRDPNNFRKCSSLIDKIALNGVTYPARFPNAAAMMTRLAQSGLGLEPLTDNCIFTIHSASKGDLLLAVATTGTAPDSTRIKILDAFKAMGQVIEEDQAPCLARYFYPDACFVFWAHRGMSAQLVSKLVEMGIDVNKTDQYGLTVLHYLARMETFSGYGIQEEPIKLQMVNNLLALPSLKSQTLLKKDRHGLYAADWTFIGFNLATRRCLCYERIVTTFQTQIRQSLVNKLTALGQPVPADYGIHKQTTSQENCVWAGSGDFGVRNCLCLASLF